MVDVDGSNLGRNVELMSPIPTKKSSVGVSMRRRLRGEEILTWDDFDKIWTPFPNICAIVDDDDHRCVDRK